MYQNFSFQNYNSKLLANYNLTSNQINVFTFYYASDSLNIPLALPPLNWITSLRFLLISKENICLRKNSKIYNRVHNLILLLH